MGAHDLALWLLVTARNASRVSLGGVHVGAPSLEVSGLFGFGAVAVRRPAPRLFAVRGHRSSIRSKLAFSPAYHVSTE